MPTDEPKKPEKEKRKTHPVDNLVESRHTLAIDGQQLKYTVVTGTMVMKEGRALGNFV